MEESKSNIIVEKKRRGPRKTKILDNKDIQNTDSTTITESNEQNLIVQQPELENTSENIKLKKEENTSEQDDSIKVPKKRGRKPKGGKIISENNNNSSDSYQQNKPNIILHLKCKMSDLEKYNSSLLSSSEIECKDNNIIVDSIDLNNQVLIENQEVSGFDTYEQFGKTNKTSELGYYIIDAPLKVESKDYYSSNNDSNNFNSNTETNVIEYKNSTNYENTNDMNLIWKKLKDLEVQLHKNDICDKRSACFWDTCEFDTPPIYIPRVVLDNTYHVYGCFCSPECAVAYLLKENIDAASRFERLYLLNHMYGKICNYERSIKPAPDPYYTLDKYYGNLSIQEYRKLLKSERLLLVVELPLTRELPELHLDNGDYLIGGQSIPTTGKYKVKKVSQKTTKANIMQERFGASK